MFAFIVSFISNLTNLFYVQKPNCLMFLKYLYSINIYKLSQISFLNYKHTHKKFPQARNMSEYLKSVKMNSMIIMAIKDSTWSWNWEQDWIEYIDSYGSETHQDTEEGTLKFDPRYDSDIGCPFTASEFRTCDKIWWFKLYSRNYFESFKGH